MSKLSSYSELIKNFEKIRTYMREFYVFGFKSRSEYTAKSARSYDDERRRVESWLGEYMRFVRTPEGKSLFLSIDSRTSTHNPLFKAWKAKSFTAGDVTLHFILLDILHSPDAALSLPEILERIDGDYLDGFKKPMVFDESTVRKKLKEYMEEGLIVGEKKGRSVVYRRAEDVLLPKDPDALHFFSEIAPCGVIGSFLLTKCGEQEDHLRFKHHYITGALDSEVLAVLFDAMGRRCAVTALNHTRCASKPKRVELVPLRVFISAQSGRQHLLAFDRNHGQIQSFRIDYLSEVKIGEACQDFAELRKKLDIGRVYMWGVNCRKTLKNLEHVEFTVRVDPGEEYIVRRLLREKRIGKVERTDDRHYRFSADVYDTNELIPWIRTFICRLTKLNFSNRTIENRFKKDIEAMYALYGIDGGSKA